MNKQKVITIISILAAISIIIAITSFAGPCLVEVGAKPMKCNWTAQAVKGLAVVMIISAGSKFIIKNNDMKKGISFVEILLALYGISLVVFLIGTCGHAEMICNTLMKPVTILLFGIYAISSFLSFADKSTKE